MRNMTLFPNHNSPAPDHDPVETIQGREKLDTSDPVRVYLYQEGDLYAWIHYARDMTEYEIDRIWSVFEHLETFIDVEFERTTDRDTADLQFGFINGSKEHSKKVTLSDGTVIYYSQGLPWGTFNFPNNGKGKYGYVSTLAPGWTDKPGGQLDPGGRFYLTTLHEIGHGLGLGHASDRGNHSRKMDSSYGLQQSIFTVVYASDTAYHSWDGRPDNPGDGDVNSTFAALDMAALQNMYGANDTHAAGDDVYVLAASRAAAEGYRTIWDTGGTDTLAYTGGADAVVDLRAATLEYEPGGGGFVSWVWDIPGGYTIAHDVVIENATTGAGDDRLTGNAADNVLTGGAGDDTLTGGPGADRFVFNDPTVIEGSEHAERLRGTAAADALSGRGGDDRIDGLGGDDHLAGNRGADTLYGNAGDDSLWGDKHEDTLYGGVGDDRLFGGKDNDVLYGGRGKDNLYGGPGGDELYGGDGQDRLQGDGGKDSLHGGAGADRFVFDQPGFGQDRIGDFEDGTDILALHHLRWKNLLIANNAEGDAVVQVKGAKDAIILEGIDAAQLDKDDFIFGKAGDRAPAGEQDYAFSGPGFGQDRITDFEDGVDRLDFSYLRAGWAGLALSNNADGDAVIQVTGTDDSVTLTGVDVSLISESDFIF